MVDVRGQAGGGGGGEGAGGSGGDERLEAVRRQLGDAQRAAVDAVDRAAARGTALDAVGVKAEALRDDADSFRNKGRGPKKDGGFAGKKQKTAWRKFKSQCTKARKAIVSAVTRSDKDQNVDAGPQSVKVLGLKTTDHSAPAN